MAAPHHERLFTNKQWDTCYQYFIASLPAESSRSNYDCMLRCLFAANPKKTPDRYTRQDIEAFANAPTMGNVMPGRPISAYGHNNRILRLKSFYTWCSRYYIEFRGQLRPILRGPAPTDGVRLKKTGESERALDEEEITRFFRMIPENTLIGLRDKAYFLTLFWTGRRQSEIRTLRWCDLEQTTFANGARGWMYTWKGKGHMSRDDSAEIPAPAIAAIKTYLAASSRITLDPHGNIIASSMRPDDAIFVGLPSTSAWRKPVAPSVVVRRFRVYATAAGLPIERCQHGFRYAAAGERYSVNGNNPMEVQQFLRHKHLETTLRYLEPTQRKKRADQFTSRLYAKWSHL